MKSLKSWVVDAIDRRNVHRSARAHLALKRWPEVVGSAMAARSRPERYEKGTVWVAVSGSAWAQELRMAKDTILERLEECAGERGLFLDVRFGVRDIGARDSQTAPSLDEEAYKEELAGLSIREIAEKRLAKWRNEAAD